MGSLSSLGIHRQSVRTAVPVLIKKDAGVSLDLIKHAAVMRGVDELVYISPLLHP